MHKQHVAPSQKSERLILEIVSLFFHHSNWLPHDNNVYKMKPKACLNFFFFFAFRVLGLNTVTGRCIQMF